MQKRLRNKIGQMKEEIIQQMARIFVPAEILEDFEIVSLEDNGEDGLVIHMDEKEAKAPMGGRGLVKDGYMRPKVLRHFPTGGRPCEIQLRRRRWVLAGDKTKDYHNTYSYTEDGCTATKGYAAFLKEIGE